MVDSIVSELMGEYTAPDVRLVHATIEAVSADTAKVSFMDPSGATRHGVLPLLGWNRRSPWSVGDQVVAAYLDEGNGQVLLSATTPDLVPALLEGAAPEVRSGRVRVMGVSRRPGWRTKVCVATTEEGLDPVGACIGKGHYRVDKVKEALDGEQVDIVAWHPEPEVFLSNAMQPAQVSSVVLDTVKGVATVAVPEHQMAAAVGGGGLNSQLAGELLGLKVRVVAE